MVFYKSYIFTLETKVNVKMLCEFPGPQQSSLTLKYLENFGIRVLFTTNNLFFNPILTVMFSHMWPNIVA